MNKKSIEESLNCRIKNAKAMMKSYDDYALMLTKNICEPFYALSSSDGKKDNNNQHVTHNSINRNPTDNPIQSYPSIIHFNNAGSSPQPLPILEEVIQHTILESLVGGYQAAEMCLNQKLDVYRSIATFINAIHGREEIALVESATVAWTRIFYSICDTVMTGNHKDAENIILCCEAEYAANVVAMQKICNEKKASLLAIPGKNGIVDVSILNDILNGMYSYRDFDCQGGDQDSPDMNPEKKYLDPQNIRLICITHIPTNSGVINPVNEIGQQIEQFNQKHKDRTHPIYYLVDACQSIGQLSIDVQEIKCDALSATGRKYLRGPRGTGFLYVKKNTAEQMIPSHIDHASAPIKYIPDKNKDNVRFEYKAGASRFEFWEANVANQLGLGRAVAYAMQKNIGWIENQCRMLGSAMKHKLKALNKELQNDKIYIHHDNDHIPHAQCGIISFYVRGCNASQIKENLLDCGITTSIVPPTSTPFDSARSGLGDRELLRISLSYFNTNEEIDLCCDKLATIIREI